MLNTFSLIAILWTVLYNPTLVRDILLEFYDNGYGDLEVATFINSYNFFMALWSIWSAVIFILPYVTRPIRLSPLRDHNPVTLMFAALRRHSRLSLMAKVFVQKRWRSSLAGLGLMSNWTIDDTSRVISNNTERKERMREMFVDHRSIIRVHEGSPGHSHPVAASFRSAANTWMNDLAVRNGYNPYNVSCAAAEQNEGSRAYYCVKDLAQPAKRDVITDNSVLIFTDVDYYADIPAYMCEFKPILMYTFRPKSMANRTCDYAYRFCGDEVEYSVRGGARYRHGLWDYTGDVVTTRDGLTGDLLMFNVEQREIEGDEEHRFIALTPMARLRFPYVMLMDFPESELRRFSFGSQRYMYDEITDMISVAEDGSYHSVAVGGREYEAINKRLRNKIAPPTVADVERILALSPVDAKSAHINAPLLIELLSTPVKFRGNVIATGTFPVSFQPIGSLATEDGKPSMRPITTPLVDQPALGPAIGKNADEASIKGRVDAPRNLRVPPSKYVAYANEFRSQVVRRFGIGVPWTVAQVLEEQNSAAQKGRYNTVRETISLQSGNKLAAFVKHEAYGAPNAPRNITTCSPEITTLMSTYTYAFKNAVLKSCKFYAPGMTPDEIVAEMAKIVANGAVTTDFNRFDGSISEWLQHNIVAATYARWIRPEHRPEFKRYFKGVFTKRARTQNGVRYDAGSGTRSGSPITTDGNTLINGFVYYCAARVLGKAPNDAISSIGLLCGDDGISPRMVGKVEALKLVCTDLGLSVAVSEQECGPYQFCGRYFIDPTIVPDSFQDPVRTIAKIHLSASMGVTREQAAANKAAGYMVTDAKTPLIGDWARRVLEITQLAPRSLSHEERYKMNHAWPQTDAELILDHVAGLLGLTRAEIEQRREAIRNATSLDDMPAVYDTNPSVKIDAVVGEEIRRSPSGSHITMHQTENVKRISRDANGGDGVLPRATVRRVRSMGRNDDAASRARIIVRPNVKSSTSSSTDAPEVGMGGKPRKFRRGGGGSRGVDNRSARTPRRSDTRTNNTSGDSGATPSTADRGGK